MAKPPFVMKSAPAKKAAPGKLCPGCKNPTCKKAGKCVKGK